MGMRDTWKGHRDVLANFVAWMRKGNRAIPSEGSEERVLEEFLATQLAGSRLVPCCGHCGGENVVPGDFRDELLVDPDHLDRLRAEDDANAKRGGVRASDLHAKARTVVSKSVGPAWVCKANGCGRFTPREE